MTEYLDEIELNLYYQITTRFQTFLDMILNLNKMEGEIDESLNKIRKLRDYQTLLRENLLKPSQKILQLKRKKLNIEKTIHQVLFAIIKKLYKSS